MITSCAPGFPSYLSSILQQPYQSTASHVIVQGALEAILEHAEAAAAAAVPSNEQPSKQLPPADAMAAADDVINEGTAGNGNGLVETERDRLIRLVGPSGRLPMWMYL